MVSRQSHRTWALIAITAGLVFTACSTTDAGDEPTDAPVEEVPTTPEPTPSEPSGDPSPSDNPTTDNSVNPVGEFSVAPQQSDSWPNYGETSNIYPTGVRAAIHDGFERVVIEHAGTGQPTFHAQYTDNPLEPGIGTPVDTGDGAYLEVTLSGTSNAYDDPPDMLDHGVEIDNLNTKATQTVVSFAPWEATSTYFVGLDEQRPFSVTVLEDPVRLVIDIQLDDE